MAVETRGKAAVFDLDGTLVAGTFEETVKRFAQELGDVSGEKVDVEKVCQDWRQIQHAFRDFLQVDPTLAVIATQIIMEEHGVNQQSLEGRRLLAHLCKGLYRAEEVKLCPGADKAIEKAEELGQVYIGTIANKGWTGYKLKKSGLGRYFPNGNVFCFNVRKHKSEQWPDFFEHYHLKPEEVFMVGDTYSADILPLIELGVKPVFWVNNGRFTDEEFWEKEVPEGVVKLAWIGELMEYL